MDSGSVAIGPRKRKERRDIKLKFLPLLCFNGLSHSNFKFNPMGNRKFIKCFKQDFITYIILHVRKKSPCFFSNVLDLESNQILFLKVVTGPLFPIFIFPYTKTLPESN